MVSIDELLTCAFEQDFGKIRRGSKKYDLLLDIVQKESTKFESKILNVKEKKEKCSSKIICAYCNKHIKYKDNCVSYYDPSTKGKKIYHFNFLKSVYFKYVSSEQKGHTT